ncbi:PE domain-containing protein [Plantactinospora sp. B6F1]|uniref:PE domain-containing protein n=1 Tax=Plantactinospora sp. B6F1 TaxID=3158971 RepID=UPI00102D199F
MTQPGDAGYVAHVPDPDGAVSAAGRLAGAGERLGAAMDRAVAALNGVGDPWGNDEVGQTYREGFAGAEELKAALSQVGKSVTGFGNVALTSVDTLIETDLRTKRLLGGHDARSA